MDEDALILAGYDAVLGRAAGRTRGGLVLPRRGRGPVSPSKLTKMTRDLPAASGRVLRQFFGLPVTTFVNAGATTIRQTDRPQRSFQMDRVVISRFNVGAASPNLVVTITRWKIGAEDMLAGNGPIPIEMFAAAATSARFNGYTAKAGIDVSIDYTISAAPAAMETVSVTWGAYGDSVAG